ncbi:hypothetical protein LTR84_005971 [Exophiala bonariae]|uniref:Uncharacterized protein n=1 Tax=Exophiala bonariae TaxID=1690606 RepID=A0AAV9N4Q6_9EURO|nr:hypothetical protein LTR84_005971 [Exophiala bonariae]
MSCNDDTAQDYEFSMPDDPYSFLDESMFPYDDTVDACGPGNGCDLPTNPLLESNEAAAPLPVNPLGGTKNSYSVMSGWLPVIPVTQRPGEELPDLVDVPDVDDFDLSGPYDCFTPHATTSLQLQIPAIHEVPAPMNYNFSHVGLVANRTMSKTGVSAESSSVAEITVIDRELEFIELQQRKIALQRRREDILSANESSNAEKQALSPVISTSSLPELTRYKAGYGGYQAQQAETVTPVYTIPPRKLLRITVLVHPDGDASPSRRIRPNT